MNTPDDTPPKPHRLHADLTAENWQEELWHLTLNVAHDTAKNIGPEICIHLAVATLHHYFLLAASTATPFPKNTDELRHALKHLGIILEDVGLDLKMTTACTEPQPPSQL